MKKIKVMSVFGTRPEATKMAPLVKALEARSNDIESIVVVTAQHRHMLDQVLETFDIRPDYDLNLMKPGQTLSGITTGVLMGMEGVIKETKPDLMLVHGDTTTSFAAALAGFYHKIPLGHVEAGLRTFTKYQPFPEEINRVLTDDMCDLHFAPTTKSRANLLREGIDEKGIFVTGNTAIDVISTTVCDGYCFTEDKLNSVDFSKKVITMTAHRSENLGEPLEEICRAVLKICEACEDVTVVYPVHKNPLVQDTVNRFLSANPQIVLTNPLDIKDMHNLINRSYLVMTDSGGLQEEAPSMGKPVLVLRNVTERPEGIEAGTLKLVGTKTQCITESAVRLIKDEYAYNIMARVKNPFGDGRASERIVDAILYYFGRGARQCSDYEL